MSQSMIFLGSLRIILAAFRYSPSISENSTVEQLPHTDKGESDIVLKYISSKRGMVDAAFSWAYKFDYRMICIFYVLNLSKAVC